MNKKIILLLICLSSLIVGFISAYVVEKLTNKTYQLILECDNDKGSVYGAGSYIKGEKITIYAQANKGYKFSKWNDGNINNIREVSVYDDTKYIAEFKKITADDVEGQYYAVDYIEIYAKRVDGVSEESKAEDVWVNFAEVSYHDIEVVDFRGFGSIRVIESGISIMYDGLLLTDENKPNSIYSIRNESNKFEFSNDVVLELKIGYSCQSSNAGVNFSNHVGSSNVSVSLTPFDVIEGNEEYEVLDDSDHGYKIYMKLHFIEL